MATLETNELHYGDNLEVMREKIPDDIADLVYLDPPFNSSRSYNLLFKQVKGDPSPAQIHAFEDTWNWSPLLHEQFKADRRNARMFELIEALYRILGQSEMMAYVLMMAPRLLELHRKLKSTGSLYLHCDPSASHYLKLVLDVVFGPGAFVNEVTWQRYRAHNDAKRWGSVHDILLFYSRGPTFTFNKQFIPYEASYIDERFRFSDADGRKWAEQNLSSPNPRPNLTYAFTASNGVTYQPPPNGWKYTPERMRDLDTAGRLHFPSKPNGRLRLKNYLDELPGVPLQDVWTDIPSIGGTSPERRGYPTQKPLALLERIIAASSNEGDVVMDPFCGCGTALVAAERMNRKWIGIDITWLAINEVALRLNTERAEGRPLDYKLIGSPKDALGAEKLFEATAAQNHKPFEQWAVTLVGGEYRDRGGPDRGVDGVIPVWDYAGKLHKIVIQVKGGQALTLSTVRDFASVIKDNGALLGLMISMKEPTREMQLVAENQGYAEWQSEKKYPKLQIRTVKELLEDPVRPFDVPDHARVPQQEGVGKSTGSQGELFDE